MKSLKPLFDRLTVVLGATTLLVSAWAQTNPVQLTFRGRWPELGPTYGLKVSVASPYAYVAGFGPDMSSPGRPLKGRLLVLDVSVPTQLTLLGYCDVPGLSGDDFSVTGIAVAGQYAYVVGTPDRSQPGVLRIVDVRDPAHPVYVGGCTTGTWAWGIDVAGSYAYVAGQDGGLNVVDVRNPTRPVLAASCAVAIDWNNLLANAVPLACKGTFAVAVVASSAANCFFGVVAGLLSVLYSRFVIARLWCRAFEAPFAPAGG